jgi:hypothetical protein
METYRTWVRLFELLRYYSWIIDRFHISTKVHQMQTYGKNYDFGWLETRLIELGFHLVFCTRTPESFEAARAERLKVSGNPKQYDSLQVFIHEQELIRRPVSESGLPTLELDISDNDVAGAADRIADWMADTGGLWAGG